MPEAKATAAQTDAALDEAFIRCITWKPSIMRNVAIKIVARAVWEGDKVFWADDVDLDFVPADSRNCIGMAWRQMVKAGILKRTDLNRRSTKAASKGRVVFKYRLASAARANTFLERNGWTGKIGPHGEQYLFDHEEMNGDRPGAGKGADGQLASEPQSDGAGAT